jgi:hypothetical protein
MATLRDRLIKARPQLLLVGEADQQEALARYLEHGWRDYQRSSPAGAGFNPGPVNLPPAPIRQGWVINTQINFCAQAYPTVPPNHPDAPALLVLGLMNALLHPTADTWMAGWPWFAVTLGLGVGLGVVAHWIFPTTASVQDNSLILLGVIALGAGVYAFATRFRTAGMGTPKDDADESSDNG